MMRRELRCYDRGATARWNSWTELGLIGHYTLPGGGNSGDAVRLRAPEMNRPKGPENLDFFA
jgi:hypothetical protein